MLSLQSARLFLCGFTYHVTLGLFGIVYADWTPNHWPITITLSVVAIFIVQLTLIGLSRIRLSIQPYATSMITAIALAGMGILCFKLRNATLTESPYLNMTATFIAMGMTIAVMNRHHSLSRANAKQFTSGAIVGLIASWISGQYLDGNTLPQFWPIVPVAIVGFVSAIPQTHSSIHQSTKKRQQKLNLDQSIRSAVAMAALLFTGVVIAEDSTIAWIPCLICYLIGMLLLARFMQPQWKSFLGNCLPIAILITVFLQISMIDHRIDYAFSAGSKLVTLLIATWGLASNHYGTNRQATSPPSILLGAVLGSLGTLAMLKLQVSAGASYLLLLPIIALITLYGTSNDARLKSQSIVWDFGVSSVYAVSLIGIYLLLPKGQQWTNTLVHWQSKLESYWGSSINWTPHPEQIDYLVYGVIPCIICFMMAERPLRFALCLFALVSTAITFS